MKKIKISFTNGEAHEFSIADDDHIVSIIVYDKSIIDKEVKLDPLNIIGYDKVDKKDEMKGVWITKEAYKVIFIGRRNGVWIGTCEGRQVLYDASGVQLEPADINYGNLSHRIDMTSSYNEKE